MHLRLIRLMSWYSGAPSGVNPYRCSDHCWSLFPVQSQMSTRELLFKYPSPEFTSRHLMPVKRPPIEPDTGVTGPQLVSARAAPPPHIMIATMAAAAVTPIFPATFAKFTV